MPQMMPMSWTTLFMFFSMTFMLFNFMNYFMYNPAKKKSMTKKIKIEEKNWKW
uniref:ATP synthase complex subunit 8 n=1 Tax=Cryptocercus zagunaoensis TaxID=1820172 RepID=A0A8K1TN07_9NEOP|nr:ATP synthase F0 subunit 8 [Cryptocercus zagunaoensis]UGN61696.1 ATP synthase F0 subunit 8 [Cryptocercus zagunaoensis]